MRITKRAGLLLLAMVVLVAASSPALTGSWVYDDWTTATHPAQDDWDDLRRVFARDSSHYLRHEHNPWSFGVTYRPLSMASLIAVQALHPALPWLHHLVSLALHAAAALGLYATLRASADATSRAPIAIAATFALHPVTIEAYGWINGRSDVLAGAFLASFALLWARSAQSDRKPLTLFLTATMAAGAALSKEPAIVGVLALWAAALLPARGLPTRDQLRTTRGRSCAALFGLLVALGARSYVTAAHVSGAKRLFADDELGTRFVQTVALAIEHLLLPVPRSMLALSYELALPVRTADWLAFGLLCGALALAAARQRFRVVALGLGAMVCLLPVLPVRHLFWLGFDRYLYIPILLLAVACNSLPLRDPRPSRVSTTAAAALGLTVLAASSFFSARYYESQTAWLKSLITTRPDDPSGYLLSALLFLDNKDTARAATILTATPRENLPPPHSHELVTLLQELGRDAEAVEVSLRSYDRYPHVGLVLLDAFTARCTQRQFDDVLRIGHELARDHPHQCLAARDSLVEWRSRPAVTAPLAQQIDAVLAQLQCSKVQR